MTVLLIIVGLIGVLTVFGFGCDVRRWVDQRLAITRLQRQYRMPCAPDPKVQS